MSRQESRVTAATPPHELPYMMRIDEVAVWMGITSAAVRAAVRRGDIPAVKRGAILRVRRDDLVASGNGVRR